MKFNHSTAALAALILVDTTTCTVSSYKQLAFTTSSQHHSLQTIQPSRSLLPVSTVDEIPSDTTADSTSTDPEALLSSRNRLIALSSTLLNNSLTGKFISRPADKVKLQKAINELEAASSVGEREKEMLLGDWKLVVTANVPNSDVRRRFGSEKKGWFGGKRSGLSLFGKEGREENPIQKSLRKSFEVTQRIRNEGTSDSGSGEINRVDNVIELTPLDNLSDIIPKESPLSFLGELNVNPLQVKKGKAVLIHKAEVESVKPVLRTKIAWTSSVLNVAGTSQFFDPQGSDIFGLNNLFGEFLNIGFFDTPYVDSDIRISRTRGPVFEQLRVFVREGSNIMESDLIDSLEAELRVEEEVEVGAERAAAEERVRKVTGAAQNIAEAAASIGLDVRSAVEKNMDGAASALGEAMDDLVARVQDVVEDDLQEIGKAADGVQKSLQEEGYEVIEAVSNVTKAVAKVPQDVAKVVEDDVANVSKSVGKALDDMAKDVQDSVEDDLKKINESIGDVRDVVSGEEDDNEESKGQEKK